MAIRSEFVIDGKFIDCYEILNSQLTSHIEEINKNYKELIKKYHPDLHPGEEERYAEKIKMVNMARKILTTDKRKKYDSEYLLYISRRKNNIYSNRKAYEEERKRLEEKIKKLLQSAYRNTVTESNYLQDFRTLIDSIYNLVTKYQALQEEAKMLKMGKEEDEIIKKKNQLLDKMNAIPKTKEDAARMILEQVKQEKEEKDSKAASEINERIIILENLSEAILKKFQALLNSVIKEDREAGSIEREIEELMKEYNSLCTAIGNLKNNAQQLNSLGIVKKLNTLTISLDKKIKSLLIQISEILKVKEKPKEKTIFKNPEKESKKAKTFSTLRKQIFPEFNNAEGEYGGWSKLLK